MIKFDQGRAKMPRKKIIEIVLDVETTGLDYTKERMVEFAAVKLENGEVKDTFETLINPEQHIRKSSMAIHNITPEMVADAPTEAKIMPKILKFIGNHPIVAHNVIFDYSYINEAAKRVTGKGIENPRVDSQFLFKEVFPDFDSPSLENLLKQFEVVTDTRHRAMADAMGLALCYPRLKKLYDKKYDWQIKQIDNIDYLFERYLRIQQAINTMQFELQDLKSIFKIYFEKGGEDVIAATGETLTYQSKHGFGYDFAQIKDVLEDIGALNKAVKLNNGFVDRLVGGRSLDEDTRNKIKEARQDFSEVRSVQIVKAPNSR